ncbi:MAG TPA: TonB-dependent receptor [Kofleriaceae bacterium]|nr:TonB-dependent receptor [Kofleriaceae bacterium]
MLVALVGSAALVGGTARDLAAQPLRDAPAAAVPEGAAGAPDATVAGAPDGTMADALPAEPVPDAAAEVIEISDTAPAESASSVHLSRDELSVRARTQVSDLLRQVPGLMVSQHAGGGKSDQYFLRGFDADHGTDLAISADGVPVNLPSHGHGQGYADTHFLIPETVASVDVHKGPYSARFGDFYTAGALELSTLDQVSGPTLYVAGGMSLTGPRSFDHHDRRLVAMASPELRAGDRDRTLVAAQVADTDGPFEHPQRFRQGNALVKWQGPVGPGDLSLEATGYAARWNASGQVPESAVAEHRIDRFGSLDPSEGGDTSRASLQLGYRVRDDRGGLWRASLFGLDYRLKLFSNFTLFARDPVHGDQIEQTDARRVWGADAGYERQVAPAGLPTYLTAGLQLRHDGVDNALWHDEQRMRLADCFGPLAGPCNATFDRITDLAGYAEAKIHVLPHVHVVPGVRLERIAWDVDDRNPATRRDPALTTAGDAAALQLLPKLSVEVEASPTLDLFASGGSGFHSNDARASVASHGEGALARALGAELGFRTTAIPHARLAAAAWYLHLDSELVWSGDAGGTEAAGSTRRYGLDLEATYHPLPWLRLDASLGVARATLVQNAGNSNALALAPRLMGQGGATVFHGPAFLALRARGIADRPGNADGTLTAQGYLICDLIAGRTFGRFDVALTVQNLTNAAWREAQFADASAVMPGAPTVEQMHFTPGIPLTATLALSYRL